jgi:hypothetical protein
MHHRQPLIGEAAQMMSRGNDHSRLRGRAELHHHQLLLSAIKSIDPITSKQHLKNEAQLPTYIYSIYCHTISNVA